MKSVCKLDHSLCRLSPDCLWVFIYLKTLLYVMALKGSLVHKIFTNVRFRRMIISYGFTLNKIKIYTYLCISSVTNINIYMTSFASVLAFSFSLGRYWVDWMIWWQPMAGFYAEQWIRQWAHGNGLLSSFPRELAAAHCFR